MKSRLSTTRVWLACGIGAAFAGSAVLLPVGIPQRRSPGAGVAAGSVPLAIVPTRAHPITTVENVSVGNSAGGTTRIVGLVVPAAEAAVRAQVDGLIVRRLKEAGTPVAAGEPVALIDDAELLLQREKFKARAAGAAHRGAAARADLRLLEQRTEQLRATQASRASAAFELTQNQCQVEAAAARVKAIDEERREADAECAALDRRIQHCRCVAPITGQVSETGRAVGEFVRAGETVATIQSRQRLVRVNLPAALSERSAHLSFQLVGDGAGARLKVAGVRAEYNLNGGRSVALEVPGGVELDLGRTVDVEVVAR